MAPRTRKGAQENLKVKDLTLRKIKVVIPTDSNDLEELRDDLFRMGCLGLMEMPWKFQYDNIVRELINQEAVISLDDNLRGQPEEWTAEVWRRVYSLSRGKDGMATRKENCTTGRFHHHANDHDGRHIKDCKDPRERNVLAFLVPILHPEKPSYVTLSLASTILSVFDGTRKLDWGKVIRDLVLRLIEVGKRSQPTYVCPFIFHLYHHFEIMTRREEELWEEQEALLELGTDSDQEKAEEVEEIGDSEEEIPTTKKRKVSFSSKAPSSAQAKGKGPMPSRAMSPDDEVTIPSVIHSLGLIHQRKEQEGRILQQLKEMLGQPQQDLVEAIRGIHGTNSHLQGQVNLLSNENKRLKGNMQVVREERDAARKWVKESAAALEVVHDFIGHPTDVQNRALLYDAKLDREGHTSGSKIVAFLINKASKMEPTMEAIRTLITNFHNSLNQPIEEEEPEDEELWRIESRTKRMQEQEREQPRDIQGVYNPSTGQFTPHRGQSQVRGPREDSIRIESVINTDSQDIAGFAPPGASTAARKDHPYRQPSLVDVPIHSLGRNPYPSSPRESSLNPNLYEVRARKPMTSIVPEVGTLPTPKSYQLPTQVGESSIGGAYVAPSVIPRRIDLGVETLQFSPPPGLRVRGPPPPRVTPPVEESLAPSSGAIAPPSLQALAGAAVAEIGHPSRDSSGGPRGEGVGEQVGEQSTKRMQVATLSDSG